MTVPIWDLGFGIWDLGLKKFFGTCPDATYFMPLVNKRVRDRQSKTLEPSTLLVYFNLKLQI
ncbi:MAG: hypothetical protein V7K32_13425 [Nostoc sp.]